MLPIKNAILYSIRRYIIFTLTYGSLWCIYLPYIFLYSHNTNMYVQRYTLCRFHVLPDFHLLTCLPNMVPMKPTWSCLFPSMFAWTIFTVTHTTSVYQNLVWNVYKCLLSNTLASRTSSNSSVNLCTRWTVDSKDVGLTSGNIIEIHVR